MSPAAWLVTPGLAASVSGLYGLMVIVTVPFTELPWVSVTWTRKLKVPAWVGVPVRTLL